MPESLFVHRVESVADAPLATKRIYHTLNALDAHHIRAEDRLGRLMRLIAGEQWHITEGTNGSFEVRRLRP